jgi:urease accessory protein
MLCERVLGNVGTDSPGRYAGKVRDALQVTWRECARRAIRGRTERGIHIGVLLPLGLNLRHGDVILETQTTVVVTYVIPCEVWVAEFTDARALATAALELGNLHVPVEVLDGSQIATLPDGPTRGVLDKHAATWWPETRRFNPLRSTITSGSVRVAPNFELRNQLTNRRE